MRLYLKILVWFFLNLVILALVFYGVFRLQLKLGFDSMLMAQVSERLQSVSELMISDLDRADQTKWNEILQRFSSAYKVEFLLYRPDGTPVAGRSVKLPEEVLTKVLERRGPLGGPGRGPPFGRGRNRAEGNSGELHSKFMLRTADPSRYWAGACFSLSDLDRGGRYVLLVVSDSFHGGGFFLDLKPWALAGVSAVVLSMFFWFPLVHNLTHSLSLMTQATERIAEGHFETALKSRRRDEIGRLANAINRMAMRLATLVGGQKRFLGDIAHELCAPIARIQMALGILEQNADHRQKPYVEDLREDVQQMSTLVNELLAFSKAALKQREIKLVKTDLAALVQRVLEREAVNSSSIKNEIQGPVEVLAEPELLARAVGNIIRNAVRYGGDAGPVTIKAANADQKVVLTISDRGPGVPTESLDQIFDPFFRLESSRSRDTGGVGLGLAIVKTCVEACQGTVSASNCEPSGLEVVIRLKANEQ